MGGTCHLSLFRRLIGCPLRCRQPTCPGGFRRDALLFLYLVRCCTSTSVSFGERPRRCARPALECVLHLSSRSSESWSSPPKRGAMAALPSVATQPSPTVSSALDTEAATSADTPPASSKTAQQRRVKIRLEQYAAGHVGRAPLLFLVGALFVSWSFCPGMFVSLVR